MFGDREAEPMAAMVERLVVAEVLADTALAGGRLPASAALRPARLRPDAAGRRAGEASHSSIPRFAHRRRIVVRRCTGRPRSTGAGKSTLRTAGWKATHGKDH